MFKNYKYLILPLLLIFIFFAKPTSALFGIADFSVADIPDQILSGVEEVAGPIFTSVFKVFILFLAGISFFNIFSSWLQSLIFTQGELISSLSVMTKAGWSFVSGISNMILVLIFLVIALAFIFKLDSFQAKKALPKLIGIALLINFSLVFVNILVDISQILYNTVVPSNDLFVLIKDVILGPSKASVSSITTWVIALGASFAIPFVNAVMQILLVALFSVLILPNLVLWLVQAIFMLILALMFFVFLLLFASRVVIIQILAILSPLAFLALILPQTKKLWDKWLKTLVEWLLLGTVLLVFLSFGFSTLNLLSPAHTDIDGLGTFLRIPSYLFYYFFVAVYMGIILLIAKGFLPKGAEAIIKSAQQIGTTAFNMGIKPIGKSLQKYTAPKIQEGVAKSSAIQSFATKMADTKDPKSKVGRFFAKPYVGTKRAIGQALRGDRAVEGMTRRISEEKSKAEKIQTPQMLFNQYQSAKTDAERIAYLSTAIKRGKAFKKPFEKAMEDSPMFKADIEKVTRSANKVGAIPDAESIARSTLHTEKSEKGRNEMLERMGFKINEDDKKKFGGLSGKLIAESKGNDIKEFNKKLLSADDFQEIVSKYWTGEQVNTAGREFFQDFLSEFQKTINKKGSEWYKQENIVLYNYILSSTARGLGAVFSEEDTKKIEEEREREEIRKKILEK